MIIYNKLDNYFVVSADRQTFLGFEMTANLRDTSPLKLRFITILFEDSYCIRQARDIKVAVVVSAAFNTAL